MDEEGKKDLFSIILGLILLPVAIFIPTEIKTVKILLFLIPYLITGWEIIKESVENIFHGKIFDENFLMTVATAGAFFIGEYPEGVLVMLLFRIGELFEHYATEKSRKSVSSLMDIRPDYANTERNGEIIMTEPDKVEIGETIIVKPGEKIPLDGEIIEGFSSLNTVALTGESLPKDVKTGDTVLSGCINLNGLIKIKVKNSFGESTVSKILELIENSNDKKTKSESFITKFSKYYTPCVVIGAVLFSLISIFVFKKDTAESIRRSLMLLVVSCPCALVVSVPLTFFGGIGGASKKGILFKGSNYIEALSKVGTVLFDKTGTLTKGNFAVSEILTEGISEEELLFFAGNAEKNSNHPISSSVKNLCKKDACVKNVEEIAGCGVQADVDGQNVKIGNEKMMEKFGIDYKKADSFGNTLYVAVDDEYKGSIVISDEIKNDAKETVSDLETMGIKNIIMLTGDKEEIAHHISEELSLKNYYAELLPKDKVEITSEQVKNSGKKTVSFVGDGINDAPVIACSDVGIAMGSFGSDATVEAADVVIMDDNISKVPLAVKIAKRTMRIAKENIAFALIVKAAVLILASMGISQMWMAIIADVGVTVLDVLNAMRALK